MCLNFWLVTAEPQDQTRATFHRIDSPNREWEHGPGWSCERRESGCQGRIKFIWPEMTSYYPDLCSGPEHQGQGRRGACFTPLQEFVSLIIALWFNFLEVFYQTRYIRNFTPVVHGYNVKLSRPCIINVLLECNKRVLRRTPWIFQTDNTIPIWEKSQIASFWSPLGSGNWV